MAADEQYNNDIYDRLCLGGRHVYNGQPVPGAAAVLQQGEPDQHALSVCGKLFTVRLIMLMLK